jgi:hypothetical protein
VLSPLVQDAVFPVTEMHGTRAERRFAVLLNRFRWEDSGFRPPTFEAALLSMKREDAPEVDDTVAAIIADVRARGDAAVIELTERFDRLTLTPDTLAFSARTRSTRPSRRSRTMSARAGTGGRAHPRLSRTPDAARRTKAGPTRRARRWAGAGRRSRRRGFMCPAGWRPTRPRC